MEPTWNEIVRYANYNVVYELESIKAEGRLALTLSVHVYTAVLLTSSSLVTNTTHFPRHWLPIRVQHLAIVVYAQCIGARVVEWACQWWRACSR